MNFCVCPKSNNFQQLKNIPASTIQQNQPNPKYYPTQSSMRSWSPYTTLASEPPGISMQWSSVALGAIPWSTKVMAATVGSLGLVTLWMVLTGTIYITLWSPCTWCSPAGAARCMTGATPPPPAWSCSPPCHTLYLTSGSVMEELLTVVSKDAALQNIGFLGKPH